MINLNAYKSFWKTDFQKEKENLLNLGIANIVKIEHIGSTATQGMFSKPVIDILIGVKNLSAFTTENIHQIESLGYRYDSVFETVFPFRRYFQKEDSGGIRTRCIIYWQK